MAKFKLEVSDNAGASYSRIAESDDIGELLAKGHKHGMWVIVDESGKPVGASRVQQARDDQPHFNS